MRVCGEYCKYSLFHCKFCAKENLKFFEIFCICMCLWVRVKFCMCCGSYKLIICIVHKYQTTDRTTDQVANQKKPKHKNIEILAYVHMYMYAYPSSSRRLNQISDFTHHLKRQLYHFQLYFRRFYSHFKKFPFNFVNF